MLPSPARPPALARALLRVLLPAAVRESFAGDLEERFHRDAHDDPSAARRAYWKSVLSPTVLHLRREVRGMPLPPGMNPGAGKGDGLVSSLLADLKFAVRTLRKAPGFTLVAVLSLALGIGPNTAIFSLVNAVLFRDWGVDDPARIVDVYTLTGDGQYFFNHYRNYELVSEGATDVFEAVTAHSIFTARIDDAQREPEVVLGEMVTGNYFDVMGVRAAQGRTFLPEEDATPGTHPVVVLSDRYWRTRFGADPALVGGEIRMNGRPYTVIGIAPAAFKGRIAPGLGSDFWVPIRMYPHLDPNKMGAGDLTISGRLRAGVPPQRAIAAVATLAARRDEELRRADPDRRGTFRLIGVSLADVRLHPQFDAIVGKMATLLFVAVGLVLLVACVNLAGFLLSRATDRRKEMAVRVAMGAGNGAIVRQLLVESLMLAGAGGVLGLVLGQVAVRALVSIQPPIPLPMTLEVGLDGPLLVFTAAAAVVAAILFGLTPALEATRAPVASTLRDEAGSSGGKRKVQLRRLLVGAQMALSTVLLFGALLFLRSLDAASRMDLGFSARDGAVVQVESWANEYTEDEADAFVEELDRRLAGQSAVTASGVTTRMPLALGTNVLSFDIPGVDPPPDANHHRLELARVTPGYFDAIGIDLLDGRDFEASDRLESAPVAILSEAAASRYWPGESAVGRVLYPGGSEDEAITVVGVVGNAKIWSLSEAPKPYLYMPYHQGAYNAFYVVARGNLPAVEMAALVQREARAIDPEIYLAEVQTIEDHLGYIYFLPRMAALLLTLIGVLALVLACIGLYGMVSYGVSRRTREMGIRLALGSDRRGVIGLVLKGGLGLVVVGAGLGIVASLGLGRLLERFVYGVGAIDPLALLAAPLVLAGVALMATYLPARRASRVDPVQALRSE